MPKLLKQLIPTLIVGLMTFTTLLTTILVIEPSDEIPLERGWKLSGNYAIEKSARASFQSRIAGNTVFCSISFVGASNDCGKQWVGQVVHVQRAKLPTLILSDLVVVNISIGEQNVYHVSDTELRRRWWDSSINWIYLGTLIAMFLTAAIHQYYFIDKEKK